MAEEKTTYYEIMSFDIKDFDEENNRWVIDIRFEPSPASHRQISARRDNNSSCS